MSPRSAHPDVWVARQLMEVVDDYAWCRDNGGNHEICAMSPVAASWPEPNPMNDLDDDGWSI